MSDIPSPVTDSSLHIWRTLIALAHVDGRFSPDEWKFLMPQILDLDLDDAQREVLYDDMHFCRDVRAMFLKITDKDDRNLFFKLANKLVYIDGDFDETERRIMEELQKSTDDAAMKTDIDFDQLTQEVRLAFEDEHDDHGFDLSVSSEGISFGQVKKGDK